MSFIIYSVFLLIIYTPMFFLSPSTWKMVKDAPNNIPMNMIGLSQTSREILEEGHVPIFTVVISTRYSLQSSLNNYCDCTGIPLSTFCAEVNTIFIRPCVQCQHAAPPPPLCLEVYEHHTVIIRRLF